MRKSVILMMAVIYVLSIVTITFFGMSISIDQFQVYMTKIEITNYQDIIPNDGTKYIIVDWDDTEGYVSVFLEYEVSPDNATYPEKVSFSISGNTGIDDEGKEVTYATVSANGEVVFLSPTAVTVTISTTDGSRLSDSVFIYCKI